MSPIAFHIPFIGWPVHWYGLVYAIGILFTAWMIPLLLSHKGVKVDKAKIYDAAFLVFLAIIIGGRLGFFLFYHPNLIITDPLQIFKLWQGGMSFHGALIGAIIGVIYTSKKFQIPLLKFADAIVIPLCVVLAFGRFANFINGELVGRLTTLSIGMEFPGWPGNRHPSQLYEMAKNLLLFLVLTPLYCTRKSWPPGTIFALWVMGYGILRFIIEFFREPDWLWIGLSGGQWLCIVMILTGKWLLSYVIRKH